MLRSSLDILRCPFCGGSLEVVSGPGLRADASTITHGTLCCSCEAYPIIDGIPCMITSDRVHAANDAIGVEDHDRARHILLELDSSPDRAEAFDAFLADPPSMTYRRALELLGCGQESEYFLYRFSDPYFVTSEHLIRSVALSGKLPAGRAIDLCGGTGHLTRAMHLTNAFTEVWLTDLAFWKVWLAKRFIAPSSIALACDSGVGLPLARDAFSFALCSGAFEYVWSRRLFGEEIQRLIGDRGLLLLTHLKNLHCATFNPGMSLSSAGYRSIFSHWPTAMFSESSLFEAAIGRRAIDLGAGQTDEALDDEPAMMLACTRNAALLSRFNPPPPASPASTVLNPLYRPIDGSTVCELTFPSDEYADEFVKTLRYMPERIDLLTLDPTQAIEQRIHLDLPEKYL